MEKDLDIQCIILIHNLVIVIHKIEIKKNSIIYSQQYL